MIAVLRPASIGYGMSRKTAGQDRCAAWIAALELYGYEGITVQWNKRRTMFEIHALRAHSYGEPAATVDVIEEWADGLDPVSHVQRSQHGTAKRRSAAAGGDARSGAVD